MEENNNRLQGQRKLKVYSKWLSRDSVFSRFTPKPDKLLPEIRLCGDWLRNIGFDCGQHIIVTHEKNKITITLCDHPLKDA